MSNLRPFLRQTTIGALAKSKGYRAHLHNVCFGPLSLAPRFTFRTAYAAMMKLERESRS